MRRLRVFQTDAHSVVALFACPCKRVVPCRELPELLQGFENDEKTKARFYREVIQEQNVVWMCIGWEVIVGMVEPTYLFARS